MKIQIKIEQVEINFEESDTDELDIIGYPRIVTTDSWKGNKNKSERLMEVIKEMTTEAIRAFNETSKLNGEKA